MKISLKLFMALAVSVLLMSGCTYKRTSTATSTHLDGTKVDFANMDKYKQAKLCYNYTKTGNASDSILDAAKKEGISKVVYVDRTITGDIACVIVYGE